MILRCCHRSESKHIIVFYYSFFVILAVLKLNYFCDPLTFPLMTLQFTFEVLNKYALATSGWIAMETHLCFPLSGITLEINFFLSSSLAAQGPVSYLPRDKSYVRSMKESQDIKQDFHLYWSNL